MTGYYLNLLNPFKSKTDPSIDTPDPTHSRVQNAVASMSQGLGATFSSTSSAAYSVYSYLPSSTALFGEKKDLNSLIKKIGSLSDVDFQSLLEGVATGDLLTSAHKSLLQDLCPHWPELLRLSNLDGQLPPRILSLIGTIQNSPLVLSRYLNTFNQDVVNSILKKDLIAWPIDNCDGALILYKTVEGKSGRLTKQFSVDIGRAHYRIRSKKKQHEFPVGYKGTDKFADMTVALKEFSLFKEIKEIPLPIQEALCQNTALTYVLTPLWESLNSSLFPPTIKNRIVTLEEGDDTACYLTIAENSTFGDTISFDYSYRFKICKINETEWKVELMPCSPFIPKIGTEVEPLWKTCIPHPQQFLVAGHLFGSLLLQLVSNLKAVAECETCHLEALKKIQAQVQKQWHTLTTQFESKNWEANRYYREQLEKVLERTSKTELGENILQDLKKKYADLG